MCMSTGFCRLDHMWGLCGRSCLYGRGDHRQQTSSPLPARWKAAMHLALCLLTVPPSSWTRPRSRSVTRTRCFLRPPASNWPSCKLSSPSTGWSWHRQPSPTTPRPPRSSTKSSPKWPCPSLSSTSCGIRPWSAPPTATPGCPNTRPPCPAPAFPLTHSPSHPLARREAQGPRWAFPASPPTPWWCTPSYLRPPPSQRSSWALERLGPRPLLQGSTNMAKPTLARHMALKPMVSPASCQPRLLPRAAWPMKGTTATQGKMARLPFPRTSMDPVPKGRRWQVDLWLSQPGPWKARWVPCCRVQTASGRAPMGSLARASLILRQPPACGPLPLASPMSSMTPRSPHQTGPLLPLGVGSTTANRASAEPGGGPRRSPQCCPCGPCKRTSWMTSTVWPPSTCRTSVASATRRCLIWRWVIWDRLGAPAGAWGSRPPQPNPCCSRAKNCDTWGLGDRILP